MVSEAFFEENYVLLEVGVVVSTSELKRLKEDFDVESFLQSEGISYATSGDNVSSGWLGISCPFCSDHANHCGINMGKKTFSCFKCGESGDIIKLLEELTRKSFSGCVSILRDFQGLFPAFSEGDTGKRKNNEPGPGILPGKAVNLRKLRDIPKLVSEYLRKRRFDSWVIHKYNLYYTMDDRKFPYRLIIPVYFRGEMVSWVGADLTGLSGVKYHGCPKETAVISNKEILYGLDLLDFNGPFGKQVVLVEGVLDKWRVGDCALAMFGKKCTEKQLDFLSTHFSRDVLMKVFLDDDAKEDAIVLSRILGERFDKVMVFTDYGSDLDPDKLSLKEISKVIRHGL